MWEKKGLSTTGGNNTSDCSYQAKWFLSEPALRFLQLLSLIKWLTQVTVKKWMWKSKLKFYSLFYVTFLYNYYH